MHAPQHAHPQPHMPPCHVHPLITHAPCLPCTPPSPCTPSPCMPSPFAMHAAPVDRQTPVKILPSHTSFAEGNNRSRVSKEIYYKIEMSFGGS